mgnify:CR=1 FL=1
MILASRYLTSIPMRTKEKGDLLEEVIRDLSSDFQDTQITKNIKLLGKKTGVLREIDVLN